MAGTSQAFFDTHAIESRVSALDDIYVQKLYSIANVDYISRAKRIADETNAMTIVEIGCGDGRALNALWAGYRNRKALGIDVSIEKLLVAASTCAKSSFERAEAGITFVQCAGNRVPVVTGTTDLVLLMHVLHHAGDLRLINEASRMLRRGGSLFVVDISNRNLLFLFTRIIWHIAPLCIRKHFKTEYTVNGKAPPVRHISPNELAQKTREAGLVPLSIEDNSLFSFMLVYFVVAFPLFRIKIVYKILVLLKFIESFLISSTPLSYFAIGIIRVYSKQ